MEEEKSKEGDKKKKRLFSAAFSTDMQMTHPPTHPPHLDPPPPSPLAVHCKKKRTLIEKFRSF